MSPSWLMEKFPHLSEADAARISKCNGGLLTKEKKDAFLTLYAKGFDLLNALKKAKISQAYLTSTRLIDRDFDNKLKQIKKNRIKQIESSMVRYATGGYKSIKTTYVADLDDYGKPQYDDKGKQKFIIQKREVATIPPNAALIMFWLKQHGGADYLEQGATEAAGYLSPNEVTEKLKYKLEEFKTDYLKIKET